MEDLQSVVSRRNKQIKELKVKLGKREREVDRLEKDLEDAKYKTAKCERISSNFVPSFLFKPHSSLDLNILLLLSSTSFFPKLCFVHAEVA